MPIMQPAKNIKKMIVLSLLVGSVGALPVLGLAAAVNPYSTVKTVQLSGEAEQQYIADKTTAVFSAANAAPRNLDPAKYVVPKGWKQEVLKMNGVSVEKYTPVKKTNRTVFFIHGGGYVGALHDRYRDWGIHQGELAGNATVLELDYRVAPAHLYPAALDDAVKAYTGLLQAGYDPSRMVLIGDSAGGNLASALAVYLRDHKIPMPQSIVLISPWTYMGNEIPSHKNNFTKDQILGQKNTRLVKEIEDPTYPKGGDVTDPYLSTAYADLTGLPPMLITAGGNELLLDDAALLAAHAKAAGVTVQFTIYPGMSHDWTILLPERPESKAMNQEIAKFIQTYSKQH